MSLKGTHKILEDEVGLPQVSAPPCRGKKVDGRSIILAASLIVGILISVGLSVFAGGFRAEVLAVVPVICVPSLFHKFVIPERPGLKHRLLVAGFYLGVWGIWPMLYLEAVVKAGWASAAFCFYGVVVFACFALGAFLPKWL